MRAGLASIPGHGELEEAYEALIHGAPALIDVGRLSLFSQWSRFDPRLSEIWVSFLIREWQRYHPIELRKALLRQPWPAAAAVLLEFVAKGIGRDEKTLFRHWSRTVTEGFACADWEQFFIGLRRIGGEAMAEDARFPSAEYRRWGYLGRETLTSKSTLVSLEPQTRREILKSLLSTRTRITTDAYWNAIQRCVSRRQAERDLVECTRLRPIGNTRGRYFLRRR